MAFAIAVVWFILSYVWATADAQVPAGAETELVVVAFVTDNPPLDAIKRARMAKIPAALSLEVGAQIIYLRPSI